MRKRKGFTMIIVISMVVILSMAAIMLHQSTNLSTLIAGNHRRQVQAQSLATSGMSHFTSMKLSSRQIEEMAGDREELLILDEQFGGGRYYVFVKPLNDNRFEVISTGERKGAVVTLSARFETFYNEEEQ